MKGSFLIADCPYSLNLLIIVIIVSSIKLKNQINLDTEINTN